MAAVQSAIHLTSTRSASSSNSSQSHEASQITTQTLSAMSVPKSVSSSTESSSSSSFSSSSSSSVSGTPFPIASSSSSSSSILTSTDWKEVQKAGDVLMEAEQYDHAISIYNRALRCHATRDVDTNLLVLLFTHLSECYTHNATKTIDRGGKIQPALLSDVLHALSYGVASYAIDATSTESLHDAFSLLTRYFQLGLSASSSVLTSIMNQITSTTQPVSTQLMCRLTMRYLCYQQDEFQLYLRATYVKLKEDDVMSVSSVAQLLKQGCKLHRRGRSPAAIKLFQDALTSFTPRTTVIANRGYCHAKLKEQLSAVLDFHVYLLLDSNIDQQLYAIYQQALAFFMLKEYEAAKLVAKRGMKMTKNGINPTVNKTFMNLLEMIEVRDKEVANKKQTAKWKTATELKQKQQQPPAASNHASIAVQTAAATKSSSIASVEVSSASATAASISKIVAPPADFASLSNTPTCDDWIPISQEGHAFLATEQYDLAISSFTRALQVDARTPIESNLLMSLFSHVSMCYTHMVGAAIDSGKIPPSHTDVLNALSYGLVAYGIDATSSESMHAAFELLKRYSHLGLIDSSVLASIINESKSTVPNDRLALLIVRYLCHEQETHQLDRSATLVKLKDGEEMTMADAAQLLKQGQMLNKRGKVAAAIKLWMRALTLFVSRACLLSYRSFAHLKQSSYLSSLLSLHTSFLLETDTIRQLATIEMQATAYLMLKEYESASLMARRGLKMSNVIDQATCNRFNRIILLAAAVPTPEQVATSSSLSEMLNELHLNSLFVQQPRSSSSSTAASPPSSSS